MNNDPLRRARQCLRIMMLCCALANLSRLHAQPSVAESNVFTLDTRAGFRITGVVLDGSLPTGPFLPLANATVAIDSTSVVTTADGRFALHIPRKENAVINVTAENFSPASRPLSASADGTDQDLGTILLRPANESPIVSAAYLDPDWQFLAGFNLQPTLEVSIDWRACIPQDVAFVAAGQEVARVTPTANTFTVSVPIDDWFQPTLAWQNLDIIAYAKNGGKSLPYRLSIAVLPVPDFLRNIAVNGVRFGDDIAIDYNVPSPAKEILSLPLIGKLGPELGLGLSFDYGLADGTWELSLGVSDSLSKKKRGRRPLIPGFARYDKPHFYVGNQDVDLDFAVAAVGHATPRTGIRIDALTSTLGVEGRFELSRYGVPPSTVKTIPDPFLRKVVDDFSVRLDGLLKFDGSSTFQPAWPVVLDQAELKGNIGIEVMSKPSFGKKLKAEFAIGARVLFEVGLPPPVFRSAQLQGYARLKATYWIFSYENEWPVSYPTPELVGSAASLRALPAEVSALAPASTGAENTWRLGRRVDHAESFMLVDAEMTTAVATTARAAEANFVRMATAPTPGALSAPTVGNSSAAASLPAQTEVSLVADVSPDAEPALAARGAELILLHVRDTGASTGNPLQHTEIAFTRFDGTSWSPPAALAPDARGQFAPVVAYDGHGDAVAVLERLKDACLASADLTTFASRMELVWSRWDSAAHTWSAPETITDNEILDYNAQLAGPLADGDLLLSWTQNPGNALIGTAASPSRRLCTRWDADTRSWSPSIALVEGLIATTGESLAAGGTTAIEVWSRDRDGELATSGDTELVCRVLNDTTWGPITALTDDVVADLNPRAWVDDLGNINLVWSREGQLVLQTGLVGPPSIVRPSADHLAVADYAVTGSADGRLVVLWQEAGGQGSDARFRVYDPASTTWSLDSALFNNSDVESAFAPVWDQAGNLTIAYLNSMVSTGSGDIATANGIVAVAGVPQLGQTDLRIAKRALVRDLAIDPSGLAAEGARFLAGDVVTLRATVRNTGNVAVQNPVVDFFDGDPTAGGVLIARTSVPGWFVAQTESSLAVTWTLPAPATAHDVFVVVDPLGAVAEYSESNNVATLAVGGVDLAARYRSGTVLRDGSVRLVVDVTNLGAPASPVTVATLGAGSGEAALTPLDSVPLAQVEPGATQTVIFDLPANTQLDRELFYTVSVDPAGLSGDIDLANNQTSIALVLSIDDDADGLPQWWERKYGLSDTSAEDATSDPDIDGFTNAQEYLAGTDPRDGASFLRLNEFNVLPLVGTVGGLRFSFSWASLSGVHYDVQRSFDLETWTTIAVDVTPTPPLNTFIDEVVGSTAKFVFYRLEVK